MTKQMHASCSDYGPSMGQYSVAAEGIQMATPVSRQSNQQLLSTHVSSDHTHLERD
jgi:hypothetical protein